MKYNTFQNMGDGDRVIRVLIGALLIGYTMGVTVDKLGWISVLPLLAIPVVMTAILSWDPLYSLVNFSTAKKVPVTTLGFMATNVGKTDTRIRYVTGFTLLITTMAFAPVPIGMFALIPLVAAVLVLSGMIGWDPLYATFKLNTLEQPENLPDSVVIQGDFGDKSATAKTTRPATQHMEDDHPKVA